MENGAKIGALLSFLAAAPAAASVVYVPCDLPSLPRAAIHRLAPVVHFKPKPHKHRHIAHAHGRRAFHAAVVAHARGMCPVFVGDLGEELGAPEGFAPFEGGLPVGSYGSELGGGDTSSGGGEGGGGAGDFGSSAAPVPAGLVFVAQPTSPLLVVDTAPVMPLGPLTPISPIVPIVPVTPAVPEASTWLMLAMGFAALLFLNLRRKAQCLA